MAEVEVPAAARTALERACMDGAVGWAVWRGVGGCNAAVLGLLLGAEVAAMAEEGLAEGGSEAGGAEAGGAGVAAAWRAWLWLMEHADALLSTVVAWTDSVLSTAAPGACMREVLGRRLVPSCSHTMRFGWYWLFKP